MARLADRRAGFTMVNLVVVVVVLAVMLALGILLLSQPKINSRRSQCVYNMEALAKAVRVFDTRKQKYLGYKMFLKPKNDDGSKLTISWQTALLSYVGHHDYWGDWMEGTQTKPYIDRSVCTDSPSPDRSHPWTTYVANCGHRDSQKPDSKDTAVFHDHTVASPVLITSSMIASGDGETNTIMLSENVDAQYWSDTDEWLAGFVYDSGTQVNADRGRRPTPNDYAHARPSSNHPGGVLMSMCDGSMKFAKEEISSMMVEGTSALQIYMTPNGAAINEPKPKGLNVIQ